jgi:hypothetical protein
VVIQCSVQRFVICFESIAPPLLLLLSVSSSNSPPLGDLEAPGNDTTLCNGLLVANESLRLVARNRCSSSARSSSSSDGSRRTTSSSIRCLITRHSSGGSGGRRGRCSASSSIGCLVTRHSGRARGSLAGRRAGVALTGGIALRCPTSQLSFLYGFPRATYSVGQSMPTHSVSCRHRLPCLRN